MSDPEARRSTRNRVLPGPWQRLERGLRFRLGEINGDPMFVIDDRQWVPIGPSVTRKPMRGHTQDMLVTGRVRDIAVHPDGQRAYAGAARGGVWYTEDAGRHWRPVGGWVRRPGSSGGPNSVLTVGCLLVDFGATAAEDFVMVGTGELQPTGYSSDVAFSSGGIGILAALGPATAALDDDPWEDIVGTSNLEGAGVYRLVRRPGVTAGGSDDVVIAASSAGLFRGVRQGGRFRWIDVELIFAPGVISSSQHGFVNPVVTDAAWLDLSDGSTSGDRLYLWMETDPSDSNDDGVRINPMFSDEAAKTLSATSSVSVDFSPVARPSSASDRLHKPAGRASMATVGDGADQRLYILGAWHDSRSKSRAGVAVIDHPLGDPAAAATTPTIRSLQFPISGDTLWGKAQWYDQAIAVIRPDGATSDHVFLGGKTAATPAGGWVASLWLFRVEPVPGQAGQERLRAVPGLTIRDPSNNGGFIGSGVHADVHVIRVAEDDQSMVWVGSDGGVSVSHNGGEAATFASRNTGLAALESGFVASHPTSSQRVIIGCQDNGVQSRSGDTIWGIDLYGDGGGVAFDPVRPHRFYGQYTNSQWYSHPTGWLTMPSLWTSSRPKDNNDKSNSEFYSNTDAVPIEPGSSTVRYVVGTDRVWVADDDGDVTGAEWRLLPGFSFPGTAPAQRQGNEATSRTVAQVLSGSQRFGLLRFTNATVHGQNSDDGIGVVRWVLDGTGRPRSLLLNRDMTIYRYEQVGDLANHRWRPSVAAFIRDDTPMPTGGSRTWRTIITDIAPVHGTNTFYYSTTGVGSEPIDTVYYHDGTNPIATGLRNEVSNVRDPAYAVTVDADTGEVYAGTALGVWRGVRRAVDNTFSWDLIGKRLPPAVVQDLHVHKPSPQAPKTLVAALESRGVWQLNLDEEEHEQTYLRCNRFDDRRVFPAPLDDLTSASGGAVPVDQSPDLIVRARWPRLGAVPVPPFPGVINGPNTAGARRYQLWQFQCALGRYVPGLEADGAWSDRFVRHLRRYRSDIGMPVSGTVDLAVWNRVMTDDALAPFRPPWQVGDTPVPPTEIDLGFVRPQSQSGGVWATVSEPITVEVLLHHRDTMPLAAGGAFAMLLWQWADPATVSCQGVAAFARAVPVATGNPGPSQATGPLADWTPPSTGSSIGRFGQWSVAMNGQSVFHRLGRELSAREPLAVAVDVDLGRNPAAPPDAEHPGVGTVVLLAIAGSTADPFSHDPPAGTSLSDFVRHWRHAAARTIRCTGPR